jgi:N-acetylmuramoyl-L-alanine amidase
MADLAFESLVETEKEPSTSVGDVPLKGKTPFVGVGVPACPQGQSTASSVSTDHSAQDHSTQEPSQRNALQALLAFSALHEQVRRRKVSATRQTGFDAGVSVAEVEEGKQFVLDEVLQLVADRAVAITGADGLAIALAENNEIILRAAAGTVRPDLGARIDRDSAFSGACFRMAQIVNCDDTETDARVNLQACRRLGARSMVAVPLCGRQRGIGLLEAFSAEPFGFNDSDVRNLSLLADLIVRALTPEEEDRFAESAQVAATKLEAAPRAPEAVPTAIVPPQVARVELAQAALVVRKPLEAEATSAPATAILHEPALGPEKASSEFEPTVATETTAEPEVPAEELDSATHRPGMLFLLVCIAIAAALAVGAWWKLKAARSDSVMVRTEKMAPKPVRTAAKEAASDGSQATNSPAKPRELSKFPMVIGIQHWSSAGSSTVVLNLEDQVQYEAHRLNGPDRIYVDLHDTQLASDLAGKSIEVGDALLNRIRVSQPVAGVTRIVLETKAHTDFSVSLEPNPYRLVVEVRKIGANPKGAINLFPNATEAEKNKLVIVVPPPAKEDLQLQGRVPKMRIVVDAGHGGRDYGTVGRDGLLEKDLVLEIGQRLGKLLESRLGMAVIYTRQDDNYIPLAERARIANLAQADLFVSVHANYSDLPSARGVETYYTNFATAPSSKDVETRLSASGASNEATASLSPADLHQRIEQSRRLAASVQRSLYETLSVQNPGLRDRGIKEAGFAVLTESAMPGILAEVSFVSSPADEQKLRSDGYREQVAEALYKGIARFAASAQGVKVASAQGYGATAKAFIWTILRKIGAESTKLRDKLMLDLANLSQQADPPKKNYSYPGDYPNEQSVPAYDLATSRAARAHEEASPKSQGHQVKETGWKLGTKAQASAASTPSSAAGTAGTLSDPRVAQLPPGFRSALHDEVNGILTSNCQQINFTAPVYDCPCFYRKSVTAQLDRGATVVQDHTGVHVNPALALIVPVVDFHECVNQSALSKYSDQRAMEMMGNYPSDKNKSIAQCVGDRVSADYKAKPGPNINYIDGLTGSAYAACSAK